MKSFNRIAACTAIILVAAVLTGCNQSDAGYYSDENLLKYEEDYEAQQSKIAEQDARYDAQLDSMEEEAVRYKALLIEQEKQAERFDAILNKWEEQAARQDAIFHKQERVFNELERILKEK